MCPDNARCRAGGTRAPAHPRSWDYSWGRPSALVLFGRMHSWSGGFLARRTSIPGTGFWKSPICWWESKHQNHWSWANSTWWSLRPKSMPLANEAPAKALVAQSQALRAELQTCDVGMVLHSSTQKVLHGHVANSSRQFKRAVGRFGFALNLFSKQSHV